MTQERDAHLFGPGPKRALAIDGGGTRGIVALTFLARIEALLADAYGRGDAFRLCDHFDLIAGTSTGAIVATGLALGMRVREVIDVYIQLAPAAFARRRLRMPLLAPRYDVRPLERYLHRLIGDRPLDTPDLRTGLLIVTKRFDTGSTWMISNSPRAPYWDASPNGQTVGNRHYKLAQLVRASSAAPTIFSPVKVRIQTDLPPGVFVDGGVSPFNNPLLPLLMTTQMNAYGLRWTTGTEHLHIVSIGCGTYRRLHHRGQTPSTALQLGIQGLAGLINDGQTLALTMAQWLSEPIDPWPINSEIGSLAGEVLGGRPLFGFSRYDVRLEAEWLQERLGERVPEERLVQLQRIDAAEQMTALQEIARRVAETMVVRQGLG